MKVAVACEDHTLDQYALRPIVQAALAACGRRNAHVHIITDPRIQGYEALRRHACGILQRYSRIADRVLFVIDGDGDANRAASFWDLLATCDSAQQQACVVAAAQEVEVWLLWGQRSALGVPWAEVRTEPHPKERFFEPLLTDNDRRRPDGGRTRLAKASLAAGWSSLAAGCPELGALVEDLR